jgi:hypothetical protein
VAGRAVACGAGGEVTVTDCCSCGYSGPQSHCHLCHTTGLTTPELLAHMADAHDVDLAVSAERWPDGEPVVLDATLQPEDFR